MALPHMGGGSERPNTIRGWILNAPTCAPVSPRRQAIDNVGKLFAGDTFGWGSTTGADYLGMQSPRRRPILPTPRSNLLGDDDSFGERFQCTSHNAHRHPGRSPREVRKVHSNAPSEVDHPMFGLHDPFRKERLEPTGTSSTQDVFRAPAKSSYSYQSAEAPYPDDRDKFNFNKNDTMGSKVSEQQSRYQWPAWTVPQRPVRHPSEMVIA